MDGEPHEQAGLREAGRELLELSGFWLKVVVPDGAYDGLAGGSHPCGALLHLLEREGERDRMVLVDTEQEREVAVKVLVQTRLVPF